MGLDKFDHSSLVSAAEPRERILTSEMPPVVGDDSTSRLRCAICGTTGEDAHKLAVGYANPVCKQCDSLALTEPREDLWIKRKPGDELITDELIPDQWDNPVYIAGVKCWRRYKFGGHVTRRDAFDCSSLEEFQEKHRIDGQWIHAFNVPQPDGVAVSKSTYEEAKKRANAIKELRDTLNTIQNEDPEASSSTISGIQNRVETIGGSLQRRVDDRIETTDDVSLDDYVIAVLIAIEREKNDGPDMLGFLERYFAED